MLGKKLRQEGNGGLDRWSGVGVGISQPLVGLLALPPASHVIWARYLRSVFQSAHLYNGHDTGINLMELLGGMT